MEGRQLLALGQQGHQLGADGGRLRLEAGDPGELAVLEDRVVPHQGGQRDTVAQPVDETEKDAGIDTGLAGRTRIDGLHNRYLYRQPKMHHFVHGATRAQGAAIGS